MSGDSTATEAPEIHRLFMVWYDLGRSQSLRQDAARQCMKMLMPSLQVPFRVRRVLSSERVEELRQEVCARLFDPEKRRLASVEPAATIGYVRRALEYAAVDAIREQRRRREDLIGDEAIERARLARPDDAAAENPTREGEFAEFAERLSALEVDDRVAVLLTLSPDRIANADWETVAARHPSTAPRPASPLDYDGASRLLWPPDEPEDEVARRRRVDRFRNRLNRAKATLIGATPPRAEK